MHLMNSKWGVSVLCDHDWMNLGKGPPGVRDRIWSGSVILASTEAQNYVLYLLSLSSASSGPGSPSVISPPYTTYRTFIITLV